MSAIMNIRAREILDSRGNPTVEVDVVLEDGSLATSRRAIRGVWELMKLQKCRMTMLIAMTVRVL